MTHMVLSVIARCSRRVVLRQVVCSVSVLTAYVEQHMQQIALRISSEKYVEQFTLRIFEENCVEQFAACIKKISRMDGIFTQHQTNSSALHVLHQP